MSQVIKAQAGTTIYQPFKEGLRTTEGITYKNSDALEYLNNKEYRKRYADYRNMNDKQREAFNSYVDAYYNNIKNGKIDFTNSGLVSLENSDPIVHTLVNDYFLSGIKGNLINFYDESEKKLYKPNLKKIIADNIFDNEDLDENSLIDIWNALDEPDPKTGIRGTTNRRNEYAKALYAEANKLENNDDYANIYRHTGWQEDINARKKTAERLRRHAEEIKNLSDIDSESWYQNAAMSNLTPTEVKAFFYTGSPLKDKLDNEARKNQQDDKDNKVQGEQNEVNQSPDGFDYFDPLSTQDIVATIGGKTYTINDSWQNLDNDVIKKTAETILEQYGRRQIGKYWTYWKGYTGKYLENLTPLFDKNNSKEFLGIYAITKGALGNAGKEFYVRTKTQPYPVKVKLIKNPDGTYIAKDGQGETYNLGLYNTEGWKSTARTFNNTSDIGEPFKFDINLISAPKDQVRQYMLSTIMGINPSYYPPMMFANMLMQLSYFFDKKAPLNQSELRLPNGSVLRLGGYRAPGQPVRSFTWTNGSYGIKFNFKNGTYVEGKSNSGRISRYLDPTRISNIEIIRPLKKYGGTIQKLQYGGISDMVQFQKDNGIAVDFQLQDQTKKQNQPKAGTQYNDLSKKQKLASDADFTAADAVRTAAAGLDLLSSLMIFPKGLNIASAVGTGISFLGYITSDIIDVIQGRQDFGDAAINDTLLLGTMAVPMFINPQRAKALGMGQKAQRAADIFSKWFGWMVAAGMIANDETRQSLSNTISKIGNGEITKLNSQDFTNIAFMVRLAGGAKEGIDRHKYNKALKQSKIDNGEHVVHYTYKEGTTEKSGKYVVKNFDENNIPTVKSIKEQILEELNKNQPATAKFTAEDITVPEAGKGSGKLSWIFDRINKNKKKTSEESSEPLAHIVLEEGEASELTPLYTRIFEKTKIGEDGRPIRENTSLGNFIRKTLKLEDFDVFFSDYNTVRNYRLGKIARLNNNLYKPLDELRAQGKRFYEIIKQEGLSEETINKQLAKAMGDYGFLSNDPASVEYARKLADFYETDLSKYDNLQIAQMMYDTDKQIADALGKKPTTEGAHETSKINTQKLDYEIKETETKVTPEDLQKAYEAFLKEKQATTSEGGTPSILHQLLNNTKDNRRQLVQKVFQNFNTDAITPIQMEQQKMIKLLLEQPSIKKGLSLTFGQKSAKISEYNVRKGLDDLVKNKTITQEEANRLIDSEGIEGLVTLINNNLSKYQNAAVSEKMNKMWSLLKETNIIKNLLKDNKILDRETLNQALRSLIDSGTIKEEDATNFIGSFAYDNIMLNELNRRFNMKSVNKVIKWATDTKDSLSQRVDMYKQWLISHDAIENTFKEKDPYNSNGVVFSDMLDALGIKGLPGKILWDRNEFPQAFRLIFDRAKADLTAQAEPPKQSNVQPNIQQNNKGNSSVVKKLFRKKRTQPQLRLETIKDLIKKEGENTSKNESVSQRLNAILNKMKANGDITEDEYTILKQKYFNNLKKLIPKHYSGGNIDFATRVLKLSGGNRITGISWTDKNQNWGTTIGPKSWKYIFGLLNQEGTTSSELLGQGDKSLWRLGKDYWQLRQQYDKDYAPNEWALNSEAVKNYQTNYLGALPDYLNNVINQFYENGRYSQKGQVIKQTKPKLIDPKLAIDSNLAAGTADWMGLGNINYFTNDNIKELLTYQQANWKNGSLYVDKESGTIFPVANTENAPENSQALSDYLNEQTLKGNTKQQPEDETEKQGIERDQTYYDKNIRELFKEYFDENNEFKLPDPQPGKDKVQGSPINWLRIGSVGLANIANILANKTGETVPYQQKSYHTPSYEFGNLSKVAAADQEYGAYMSRKPTSSLRDHEAFIQNIVNAHHKARQEGYDLDRTERKESKQRALENISKDLANATTVYNNNLKNYTDAVNANNIARAQLIVTNANNWKNFIDTMTTELSQFEKLRAQHNLVTKASMYNDNYLSSVNSKRENIYTQILNDLSQDQKALEDFKELYPNSNTNFEESVYAKPYKQKLEEFMQGERLKYYLNLEQLYNSTYDGRRYWNTVWYKYLKPNWHGQPDYMQTYNRELKKEKGGKIYMAKRGGASVNWVRVENARMINKSIQNDIKHTYDSLKEANRELQKNIRAMAPLIKQLNKTETVKLR